MSCFKAFKTLFKRIYFICVIAYLSTTASTVSAMIASFFASQQTFCFLQLQAEKEASHLKSSRFRALDPTDAILTKV